MARRSDDELGWEAKGSSLAMGLILVFIPTNACELLENKAKED